MTMQQAAINHAAILTAAARLEAKGYTGDAAAFCESLIVGALADGYAPIEPAPSLAGPSSTRAGREAARKLFEETLKKTKETTR